MTLEALRNELTQVDNKIVDLMAKRQEIVSQIGKNKRESGRQVRDFAREKQVISDVRSRAQHRGVQEELAQSVFELLIQNSLARQEKDKVHAAGQGTGKTALVIGGLGKIGAWFAEFLNSQGYDVSIADPGVDHESTTQQQDWKKFTLTHDVIVVATPLGISGSVLNEIATRKPSGLVFDVASLKTPIQQPIQNLVDAGCKVTSIHPMFGPDTEMLAGRHIIFVDAGNPDATHQAKALFAHTMAKKVDMTLDEHDRLIGYVLGLSHILNIAFFTVLESSGEDALRLKDMSSTSFDAQLTVAKKISRENPRLYFEIQKLNEHGKLPRQSLKKALTTLMEIIDHNDEGRFIEVMERGEKYLKTIQISQ